MLFLHQFFLIFVNSNCINNKMYSYHEWICNVKAMSIDLIWFSFVSLHHLNPLDEPIASCYLIGQCNWRTWLPISLQTSNWYCDDLKKSLAKRTTITICLLSVECVFEHQIEHKHPLYTTYVIIPSTKLIHKLNLNMEQSSYLTMIKHPLERVFRYLIQRDTYHDILNIQ